MKTSRTLAEVFFALVGSVIVSKKQKVKANTIYQPPNSVYGTQNSHHVRQMWRCQANCAETKFQMQTIPMINAPQAQTKTHLHLSDGPEVSGRHSVVCVSVCLFACCQWSLGLVCEIRFDRVASREHISANDVGAVVAFQSQELCLKLCVCGIVQNQTQSEEEFFQTLSQIRNSNSQVSDARCAPEPAPAPRLSCVR